MANAGTPYYNPRPDMQTAFNQGSLSPDPNSSQYRSWDEVIQRDPTVRQLVQAGKPDEATNYLRSTYGLSNAYKVDEQGNIKDAHNWLVRNLWWVGPAALVGGSAIGAAASGGAPAATQSAGAAAGHGTTAAAEGLLPNTASAAPWYSASAPLATEGAAAGTPLIGHAGIDAAVDNWANGLGSEGSDSVWGSGAPLGGVGSKIKDYLKDPKNIAGLAATIPAIASGTGGGNSPLNDPTVQQLLQMSLKRQQRTDPLHEAVTSLSMAMLPTAYQKKGA